VITSGNWLRLARLQLDGSVGQRHSTVITFGSTTGNTVLFWLEALCLFASYPPIDRAVFALGGLARLAHGMV
jgi:hypothetical protein